MPYEWITLSWGTEGAVLFLLGFVSKDRLCRYAGFSIFSITLLRLFLVELSGLETVYKVISFVVLGILFLVVSFIYNKYSLTKK